MTPSLIDTPPAVLAPALEQHARRYIQAHTRSGDALLEAVAALADARAAAAHGEWGIFLAAVGLDDSRARALIRLHEACLSDAALADRVRSGWISEAAARELLPAPADVRAAVLDGAARYAIDGQTYELRRDGTMATAERRAAHERGTTRRAAHALSARMGSSWRPRRDADRAAPQRHA